MVLQTSRQNLAGPRSLQMLGTNILLSSENTLSLMAEITANLLAQMIFHHTANFLVR